MKHLKEFNLEWFINKTLNKQISIESIHTDAGLLGVTINLIINDIEIETAWWNGYKLKINNGSVVIYFTNCKQSEFEECSNILLMYREGEQVIAVNLPKGDTWE